ncbi:MAG: hypothetical protein A3F78_07140 [Burkholderiales bacterium RIFCSPLOWO2_12_FULL_61_40]|nr:MAG: hypothetical protein A3F78_07140 [Burkholderiales bacterium RIFCSPLOWO2_12_FULL_61_40]
MKDSGRTVCQDEDGYIVLVFGFEDVIGEGAESKIRDLKIGFFQHFSNSAGFNRLAVLKMSSGRRPAACAVCPLALAEQYPAILDDKNADPNLG